MHWPARICSSEQYTLGSAATCAVQLKPERVKNEKKKKKEKVGWLKIACLCFPPRRRLESSDPSAHLLLFNFFSFSSLTADARVGDVEPGGPAVVAGHDGRNRRGNGEGVARVRAARDDCRQVARETADLDPNAVPGKVDWPQILRASRSRRAALVRGRGWRNPRESVGPTLAGLRTVGPDHWPVRIRNRALHNQRPVMVRPGIPAAKGRQKFFKKLKNKK
jgi:hypothetical protein